MPGRTLTIDIAFDWDSKPKGTFDGFCLCGAAGFDMAMAGNPPGNARGLGLEDELQFTIYDISHQPASRSVSDVMLRVCAAHDANKREYPFEESVMGPETDGWYPIADPTILSQGNGMSAVYGGPYPLWRVAPRPLALVTPGWYFFQVWLTATDGSGSKRFGDDPEFIVRPSG